MRCYAALVGTLCCLGCADQAQPKREAPLPPTVKAAECRRASKAIVIDGKLDDEPWKVAPALSDFAVYWQKRKAKVATTARLLWDDRFLYFAAEMADADVYALVKEPNGETWYDDVFELFFKPSSARLAYYEFQVNAANTPFQMFLPSRGAGGFNRFRKEPTLGLESAVVVRGTLNKWQDADEGWTVEGRIPWTAFAATGGRPKAGDKWHFALCRYDYSAAHDNPDLSSTAPLTVPNFHQYEDFGILTFVGI